MKNIKTTEVKINVKIHIPKKISESVKQQKINRLYDILKPKNKSA